MRWGKQGIIRHIWTKMCFNPHIHMEFNTLSSTNKEEYERMHLLVSFDTHGVHTERMH